MKTRLELWEMSRLGTLAAYLKELAATDKREFERVYKDAVQIQKDGFVI